MRSKRKSASSPGASTASSAGMLITTKAFHQMTPQEGQTWLESMRERLLRKMKREHAYLDRRAQRGTHTPTDEAYEQDQVLESELLALLDGLLDELEKGRR